jgi:hypothetical protein
MRFLGFSTHEKGAPMQEISKWSTDCSTFSRSGWSVVRSASLAKGDTSKKIPSPHLHKVPSRSNKVSPRTLKTAHVYVAMYATVRLHFGSHNAAIYGSSDPLIIYRVTLSSQLVGGELICCFNHVCDTILLMHLYTHWCPTGWLSILCTTVGPVGPTREDFVLYFKEWEKSPCA